MAITKNMLITKQKSLQQLSEVQQWDVIWLFIRLHLGTPRTAYSVGVYAIAMYRTVPYFTYYLNYLQVYLSSRTVQLLKSYCLPFVLYASEAAALSATNIRVLDNCINRAVYRIFGVNDSEDNHGIFEELSWSLIIV